jgi:hypothetical protein
MSNLVIPDFSAFDGTGQRSFPYRVEHINMFQLTAHFPAIADWEDTRLKPRLQDRMFDDLTRLLRTAEFFRENRLKPTRGDDYIAVEFEDDIYDFRLYCYQNRITVVKNGIQLKTFHHWYHAAVPGFNHVFTSLLSLMGQELKRTQSITRVGYGFDFIAYDFVDGPTRLRNYQVIKKLITQVPAATGVIEPMTEGAQNVSRANYLVNCWDGDTSSTKRQLTYSVEAPSNRDFAGLWFNFGYGNETYSDPESGRREWIDPQCLLDEYNQAYHFMWERAVGGFMKSLISQLSFKTTPAYIP